MTFSSLNGFERRSNAVVAWASERCSAASASNMCCGVTGQNLVVRLGNEGAATALNERHTRPMDFTGRPMKSMVYVAPAGTHSDKDLSGWLDRALRFARGLPPKRRKG